jgi:hypothetical protein
MWPVRFDGRHGRAFILRDALRAPQDEEKNFDRYRSSRISRGTYRLHLLPATVRSEMTEPEATCRNLLLTISSRCCRRF